MADLDLIPNDYRRWLSQQALLRNYAFAFAACVVMIVVAALLLGHAARIAQARSQQLKADNAITQQQQIQLQQLKEQQAEYERQWSLLRGLRAGAAIDDIFSLIDRSIVTGDLWFLDWRFRRAGVIVDGENRGVETGYFIIVAENSDPFADPDLEVETHMTIRGQAKDHQALSKFVRALFEQQDIKDVNVQRTSQTNYANGHAVDFDMTLVLNSAYKET
ncbi:MAG: PilN domain-containing protein [Gammaproteobacteria bacterium]|nr:PilN domain-containing protein [Gammaproteobacteria bacterium]MDH3430113.1 PilN domain-containing protein [Gammaproteobacteria bacterium]MDH3433978.1 PilN domain-containing protein [Gammaproteobacteria bacterium]